MAPALDAVWFPVAEVRDLSSRPTHAVLLGRSLFLVCDERTRRPTLALAPPRRRSSLDREPEQPPFVAARDGLVWVSFDKNGGEPPAWPHAEQPGFRGRADIACNYVQVIENMMDATHAGFVHGGLLRGAPSKLVHYTVEETATGVVKASHGEQASGSLLYRLFGRGEDTFQHVEEYIVPHTVHAEYRTPGGQPVFSAHFVCSPCTMQQTKLFYRVCIHSVNTWQSRISRLLLPVLKPLVRRVMEQDRWILEIENATLRAGAPARLPQFSTAADVAATWSARRALDFARSAAPVRGRTKSFELRL